jgi:DNA-directed RNA polymerase specialized sigma24 family protein
MRVMDGLDFKAIGAELEMSEAAVRGHHFRALRCLRDAGLLDS